MRELNFLFWDEPISLEKNNILTFVIENKKQLFSIEKYARFEFSGEERYFTFSIDKKPVSIDEYVVVLDDLFVLDVNTKKNINSLYKILSSMYGYKVEDDLALIKNKIKQIVKEISMECNLELIATDTIKDDDIFKLMELKINDDLDDPIKRVLNFINVVFELRNINVFLVFRLHEYFEKEDIDTILKELAYKNIRIIDIESNNNFKRCENERVIIYDNALCVLA